MDTLRPIAQAQEQPNQCRQMRVMSDKETCAAGAGKLRCRHPCIGLWLQAGQYLQRLAHLRR